MRIGSFHAAPQNSSTFCRSRTAYAQNASASRADRSVERIWIGPQAAAASGAARPGITGITHPATRVERTTHCLTRAIAGWRKRSSGGIPLDQLAGDDDLLQLVGALADREERRVAVVALDVELLGVAVGAVDAHRLEAVLERGFGGEELGHAGFHVATPARVVGARGRLDQQARGLGPRRHVGELQLYRLVLGDRLAEALALLGVAQGFLQAGAGEPRAPRRDVDAPELEPVQHLL